jgi:PAS domain S-box-containing protein
MDLALDAMLVYSRRRGIITAWNGAATELYGWLPGEAIGRRPDQLLRTVYPEPVEQIEDRVARFGRWEGELRQVGRDGRTVRVRSRWAPWSSEDGGVDSIVRIETDITGRIAAERHLRLVEDSFRLLVSGVRDYAIFMLDQNGRIVTWNDGAERIKGYREDEVVGRHFSLFYDPADVEAGKPDRGLSVARRDGRSEDEGWRLRKDGSRFWANVVITALRDETGRLRGYGKVTRDITERKLADERRVEEQRREAAQLREHAARMVELEKLKGDFLNLASHELRGPLAVLTGYLSMFRDGTLTTEDLPHVLPVLTVKVQEMEFLVQQLLETARMEEDRLALQPERFDLRSAVERVADRVRLAAAPKHSLVLALPDAPVPVVADRGRVETVIANLVDNAIKYSPSGGPVRCAVASISGRASVSVEDSGIGIAPDALAQLFTRFGRIVTPDSSHISGTGLGLYLSREIARRHGGDIEVESRRGQGSRFTLTLPSADDGR